MIYFIENKEFTTMGTTNKKSNTLLLVVGLIIAAAGLCAMVWNMISELPVALRTLNIASIMVCVLTIFYGVSGYNIPHGNVMRVCFLAYACLFAADVYFLGETMAPFDKLASLASIVIAAYMAGRLRKKVRNIISFSVVLVLQIIGQTLSYTGDSAHALALAWSEVALWAAMGLIYLARFDSHIEAGKAE